MNGPAVAERARELPPGSELSQGPDGFLAVREGVVEAKHPAQRRCHGAVGDRGGERLTRRFPDLEGLEREIERHLFVSAHRRHGREARQCP